MAGQDPLMKTQILESFKENLIFSHPQAKHIDQLVKFLEKDPSQFENSFFAILSQFIQGFKSSESCKKGLNIVVSLFKQLLQICCHYESKKSYKIIRKFVLSTVNYLFSGIETKVLSKRESSVWLLEKILSMNIQQLLEFPEKIIKNLKKSASVLLKDNKTIRRLGIKMACSLDIIDEFLPVVISDSDAENRKTAIKAAQNKDQVQVVAVALKDLEASVRRVAFEKILEWGTEGLNISDKRLCFFACSNERDSQIKLIAVKIALSQISTQGFKKLIESLEIEKIDPLAQRDARKSIRRVLEEIKTEDLVNLTQELLARFCRLAGCCYEWFLMVQLIKYLKKNEEQMVFDLLNEANVLRLMGLQHPESPFLYTQGAVSLALMMDTGSEEIRAAILEGLFNICRTFPVEVIEKDVKFKYQTSLNPKVFAFDSVILLKFVAKAIKTLVDQNPNEFLRTMTELINEIREPIVKQDQDFKFVQTTQTGMSLIQKQFTIKAKIEELDFIIEELEENKISFIENEKVQAAFKIHQEIQTRVEEREKFAEEIEKISEDIEKTLVVSLVLTTEMLALSKNECLQVDIADIEETLINPAMETSSQVIADLAFECLGQCFLNHCDALVEKKNLFFKILMDRECEALMRAQSIVFYIDLFMIKDPKSLQKILELENLKEKNEILWGICNFSFSENEFLRAFAVEGLVKLFLSQKVKSSSLLSALMISYFDNMSPDLIKQSLHLFFPYFSILSNKNPVILSKAFKNFVLFLFCVSTSQDNISLKYSFNTKKIFQIMTTCLSPAYTKKHGNFDLGINFSLDIFYHICQTSIKILTWENRFESRLLLKPEVLIRFLQYINISHFSNKELFLCLGMMKKINLSETSPEYTVLRKLMEKIEKMKIGYSIVDELDNNLIDNFIKSEATASKFFSKLNSDSEEVQEALIQIKNVFNVYSSMKKSAGSRICSELKRSKNI